MRYIKFAPMNITEKISRICGDYVGDLWEINKMWCGLERCQGRGVRLGVCLGINGS